MSNPTLTVEENVFDLEVDGDELSLTVTAQTAPVLSLTSGEFVVSLEDDTLQVVSIGIQGPQGPPGSGGGGAEATFDAENKDAVTFAIGQPVAIHTSGTGVVLASAADNSKNSVGLATTGAAPTTAETVQVGGLMERNDWTAVTGSTTLTNGVYYLSATAGLLTTTAPTTSGQVYQRVGRAVSTTELEINIEPSILL